MVCRLLADAVVVLHLAFVLFVVLGAALVARRPWLALVHLPTAAYGVAVELVGFTCPLTPLENALRRRGGEAGYPGGFVEHYLLPLLYPDPMPRWMPYALAALVLGVNAALYGRALRRGASRRSAGRGRR